MHIHVYLSEDVVTQKSHSNHCVCYLVGHDGCHGAADLMVVDVAVLRPNEEVDEAQRNRNLCQVPRRLALCGGEGGGGGGGNMVSMATVY